ncbi:c-type cytochrome [Cytophaga aurantiaca]|uniref:c-type cytochrome n=1 Tax=Cytophaga aurantiaca TaxID=29530 RepID=UPI000363A496|nr:cytochrome c [Cytophaga aurantiaca]
MYKSLIVITTCLILIISYQSLNAETVSSNIITGVHPGKVVYETYCLTCHQADGYGVPGLNPPIVKTEWVLGDKNRLINIVLKGLNTPINVNGQTYRNPMPSHAFLTDVEIANVLTYVRSNFGNKASAITTAEVQTVRAAK